MNEKRYELKNDFKSRVCNIQYEKIYLCYFGFRMFKLDLSKQTSKNYDHTYKQHIKIRIPMKQISKQYYFNIQAELKDLNELVTVIKIIRNSIFFINHVKFLSSL